MKYDSIIAGRGLDRSADRQPLPGELQGQPAGERQNIMGYEWSVESRDLLAQALCLVNCLSVMTCRQEREPRSTLSEYFLSDIIQSWSSSGAGPGQGSSLFSIQTKTQEIKSPKRGLRSEREGPDRSEHDELITRGPGVRPAVMVIIHVNINICPATGGGLSGVYNSDNPHYFQL